MIADSPYPSDTELADFRAIAEDGMVDTCVVEYLTGATVKDTGTDRETPVWATRFTSPCKVQVLALATERVKLGEQIEIFGEGRVDLPVTCPQVHQNDRVRFTAVGPDSDPRLMTRTFYVGTAMNKTWATATRLTVKEAP